MGKIQKMVWPQGKNLKPQPKGRAPVQPIPGPRPRKASAQKRQDQEYRLAISKGHYPLGQELLTLQASLRQEISEFMGIRPEMMSMPTTSTSSEDPAALTPEALMAMMDLLKGTPAPSREPIEISEAEYQALKELPVATTPHELALLTSIYGTAVMVVKAAPLEGEIHPPDPDAAATDPMTRAMRNLSEKVRQMHQDMTMATIWGWKVP